MDRRSFLGGLIAAPLVAHADNLMRIRGIILPRLDTRWLGMYDVGKDEEVIRFDVVLGRKLLIPPQVSVVSLGLQAELSERFAPQIAEAERMALATSGQQFVVQMRLPAPTYFSPAAGV